MNEPSAQIGFGCVGLTTLPIGTVVRMQYDTVGLNSNSLVAKEKVPSNVQIGNYALVNLGSPITTDTDGIAASQSVAAGASFLLNGATGATLDVPRNVTAAWTTTSILTITGLDGAGNVIVEKSASGTSHTGTKAFKSITSVSSSAAITSAIVGFANVLGLPFYVDDANKVVGEMLSGIALPRKPGRIYVPWEIEQTELLAPTAEQIVCPVAGWIAEVRGIVQGAVTTGGAITVEINTVAVTGLTFTIADADAAGVRYSDTPTTRHGSTTVVAVGDAMTITPASAIATAGQLNGMLGIDVSAAGQLDGTFVAAVNTTPTGTTGDVRGTYAPSVACDGALSYQLLVACFDPANLGVGQYIG